MNKSVNHKTQYPRPSSEEDELNIVSQLAMQTQASGSTKIVRAEEDSHIVRADFESEEDSQEGNLRPLTLSEFMGQKSIKENLSVFINAARERKEALDHLFLIGPPGLGKTTLAQIVANELGADFKVTSAPALDKPKDLAGILSTITPRTVFFIDEIHRLKPAIEEMLYIAMDACHAGTLHHLSRRVEGAQTAQLHGYALCHQFGQTLGDHRQHVLDVATRILRAVVDHVLGEAADGQSLLHVHLRIVLAVAGVLGVLVLSQVDAHDRVVY